MGKNLEKVESTRRIMHPDRAEGSDTESEGVLCKCVSALRAGKPERQEYHPEKLTRLVHLCNTPERTGVIRNETFIHTKEVGIKPESRDYLNLSDNHYSVTYCITRKYNINILKNIQ